MRELPHNWTSYPGGPRNRLLKLLIEKVELHHNRERVEAVISWRAGVQQRIVINHPPGRGSREKRWTEEEVRLLKMLWPSSSRQALEAAMPNRTWSSISNKAGYAGLTRQRQYGPVGSFRRWTPQQETKARAWYEEGMPVSDMARELNRSPTAILARATTRGWRRPASAKWKRAPVTWESDELKLLEEQSSAPIPGPLPRRRG